MSTRLDEALRRLVTQEPDTRFAHVLRSTANRDFPGSRVVVVTCPFCGHEHQHGAKQWQRGLLGHRVGHCYLPTSGQGYWLIDRTPRAKWEVRP